ncbi:Glycosyltransferase family 92 protein F13G3.3 [Collichthys lucidus]|uniref:Glycosyltransferase family 92 protein n=1 Tax=Collichthys lucidus TaxID=240159 RepID=A0A4U5VFS3_COLLU|nr:Glycosyltransferase family 92 protein F13G3.3 [Collichthys lucidus]
MEEWKKLRRKFFFLFFGIFVFMAVVVKYSRTYKVVPQPIRNIHRVLKGAMIKEHPDNFGFAFITTFVMCQIPRNCTATHVSLLTELDSASVPTQIWLPIRNQKAAGKEDVKMQFDMTVCISNLFEFNNALQYAQTLEMYRLLGVDRVVIYNTSCGPDLNHLLQCYSQEGFVEMVPWPIDKHMNPSHGWFFSAHGGDMHYYGQIATLNECLYRYMDRSRYVLLHDIDEIVMPYKHDSLQVLLDLLQKQLPKVEESVCVNFKTQYFKININVSFSFQLYPCSAGCKKELLPEWRGVPGFNILEHVYKWDRLSEPLGYKMIVQPRMVVQTSVHYITETKAEQFLIPHELGHIIHCSVSTPYVKPLKDVQVDTRLWDFGDKLIPNVNQVLKRSGLLGLEWQS